VSLIQLEREKRTAFHWAERRFTVNNEPVIQQNISASHDQIKKGFAWVARGENVYGVFDGSVDAIADSRDKTGHFSRTAALNPRLDPMHMR